MRRLHRGLAGLAVLYFGLVAPKSGQALAAGDEAAPVDLPALTIAIVKDGPSEYFDTITTRTKEELATLAEGEFALLYKEGPDYDAQWDLGRVETILRDALDDPEVDMVLAMGVLASEVAAKGDFDLTKPVLSGFVQDPDAMGMPYDQGGKSTRENFNFVVVPLRSTRDVRVFRDMVGFDELAIVCDSKLLEGVEDLEDQVVAFADAMGLRIRCVPVGESADEVLERLDDSVEAVYLTPALRLSAEEWQKLITGINEKKIPSFSLLGHEDVRNGVLGGLSPDINDRLARRLALNVQQILLGAAPEELSVLMNVDEQLMLNARTAARIGFSPRFDVMATAEVLHHEEMHLGDKLTLAEAIRLAAANNLQLAVKREEVEAAREDRNKALTGLFPQLEANARYYQVDRDRAEASAGFQPEDATTAGISVTQLIFSDPTMAAYRSLSRAYRGKGFEREATRLDVAEDAAQRFLDVLSAQSLYRIELLNLQLIQENLDLARVRFNAGVSGPEEIYRWETEIANSRGSVATMEATLRQALVALNQAMNVDLATLWNPRDIDMNDGSSYYLSSEFTDMISNNTKYEILQRHVLGQALENAPELKALDSLIEAQEIALAQLKRRFVLPDVGVSFTYDHKFDENFAGPALEEQLAGAGIPVPDGPEADEDEWMVALQASWPLFSGGGKAVDVAKARAELQRLQELRRQAVQLIEQRAYTAMFGTWGSYPNIGLSRKASEMARKNLRVVREKYAQGEVSIVDLLDAQNQAFVQEQAAALAVYQYVSDVISAERAMSWFEALASDPERALRREELRRILK